MKTSQIEIDISIGVVDYSFNAKIKHMDGVVKHSCIVGLITAHNTDTDEIWTVEDEDEEGMVQDWTDFQQELNDSIL